jgi:hypothetical protein
VGESKVRVIELSEGKGILQWLATSLSDSLKSAIPPPQLTGAFNPLIRQY